MGKVHDFHESLEVSKKYRNAPWWEKVCRKAFPNFESMNPVCEDGWAQRGGIDRLVMLKDGTVIKIDDKVREEKWPDFCLEFWSDTKRKRPGWITKDLTCDFIAYAFVPTEECYLLPFRLLRRAWKENGREWVDLGRAKKRGFSIIKAKNRGYFTTSVGVPIPIVLDALADAMLVRWGR